MDSRRKLFDSYDYAKFGLDLSFEQDIAIRDFYYAELFKILDNFPQMIPDVKYSTLIMFTQIIDKFPLHQNDLFIALYTCIYLTSKIEHWSLSIVDFISEFNLSNITDIQSKIIDCEIKIINILEFNLNFPNPINMLRAIMIVVEQVIKHSFLEDLSFTCEKFINSAFRCRNIINEYKISDIVLSSFIGCSLDDLQNETEDDMADANSSLLQKILQIIDNKTDKIDASDNGNGRMERIKKLSEKIYENLEQLENQSDNLEVGLRNIIEFSSNNKDLKIVKFW